MNIIPHNHTIQLSDRMKRNNHKPLVIWFTGLSGSGKSTLSDELEKFLFEKGYKTYLLDGDNVRSGLNSDLDFSEEGRIENIRRLGEVSKLFIDAGIVVLTAFISPFRMDREKIKENVGAENFVEVFVDCPLEVCEQRDTKGLYAKARKGEIKNFTGIDSPFEAPQNPDVHVHTDQVSIENGLEILKDEILPRLKM